MNNQTNKGAIIEALDALEKLPCVKKGGNPKYVVMIGEDLLLELKQARANLKKFIEETPTEVWCKRSSEHLLKGIKE